MNAWSAPQRIIHAHPLDQCPQVRIDWRPASERARLPSPVPAEARTMPSHKGLGPDYGDRLQDRREPPIQLDQEPAIAVGKLSAPMQRRRSTANWRRRAAFSASSPLFDLKGEASSVSKKQIRATIVADIRRFCHRIKSGWSFQYTQPAAEIEALVARSVRQHVKPSTPIDDRRLIDTHVVRVDVQPEQLVIELTQAKKSNRPREKADGALHVPWHKAPSTRRREILPAGPVPPQNARAMRSENRATLIASIARARRWLNELINNPAATTESVARRETCSVRRINMTISLAFLAPDLVKAAIEGGLPRGMGVVRLCDLPAEWHRQHQMLGLTAQ
jgi:hypothetical protein